MSACGNYFDYKDRTCRLCHVVSPKNYSVCLKYTQDDYKRDKQKTILQFVHEHCPYSKECYGDDGDYFGCSLDCLDGYYGKCTPFDDECKLKEMMKDV